MAARPPRLYRRSWLTDRLAWRGSPWGFLGDAEGLLLHYLARDHFRGDGVIVDAGSFLGRSAWFLATGLQKHAAVRSLAGGRIHCFDNFLVNDEFTRDAIRGALGVELPLGASTRRLFDDATSALTQWLTVHDGDFLTGPWTPQPVEILFVDIVKSEALNHRLVELMFPCLIPGHSVVIQQDYHHPWLPHVHLTMEALHEYFTLVETRVDDSAAFQLVRPIPPEAVRAAASVHLRPFDEQLALMDRALQRLPVGRQRHVALARARLIGVGRGADAMQAALLEADAMPSTDRRDPRWTEYRRQMDELVERLRRAP